MVHCKTGKAGCGRDVAIVGAVTEKAQCVFLDVELRTPPVTALGVVLKSAKIGFRM